MLCRQRKTRCDRKRLSCSFCGKNSFECQFVTSRKAPGVRAGCVSELERRITVRLENEFQEFKEQSRLLTGSTARNDPAISAPLVEPKVVATETLGRCDSTAFSSISGKQLREYRNLSPSHLARFCEVWFEKYHLWFPVLHQPTTLDSCRRLIEQPHLP
ncbi:hypothetical protein BDY21DRAFT_348347 [Lineolata rhizophorae]|uniref:Zn(2)-C6 fungal-type domain-containing protein n=1 Tax=Lineolata rhizophorae TaxID=578093 RepID=A0A6A6NXR1_9PEZI|nr:hypothetical protein BDY21DRAFT_348347 [Lineolata rhizophorae]